jgi:hypothetical protein
MNDAKEYVAGDGNCLFRCVALGVFGDESRHLFVRETVVYRARQELWKSLDGKTCNLFPLGVVYLTGANDAVESVEPNEYLDRMAVPNTFSEEIDVILIQKLFLDVRMTGMCIVRKNCVNRTFGAYNPLEYTFTIFIECERDVHFNVLDVGGARWKGLPRRVEWAEIDEAVYDRLT